MFQSESCIACEGHYAHKPGCVFYSTTEIVNV